MGTTKRVTDAGIRIIQLELNERHSNIEAALKQGHPQREDALRYMFTGADVLARRLGVSCSCRPKTSGRSYCQCKRQRPSGKMLSGARLDLSGNCRDKAGKFVPVRNCTGRGPATKTRKKAKKKAKRR